MKNYSWIKQENDAEIYLINGTYYKAVWGYATGEEEGVRNTFETDVCVYKWEGEECTVNELPSANHEDWKASYGFDFEVDNDEIDWEDYASTIDGIFSELEESK